MSLSFQESLSSLGRLSAVLLDKTSRRIRKSLADSEWKMSLCLLAMVRSGGFRELGYATISEYGERALNLSGKKLAWLLGAARALEYLPILSQAFREGRIGWGKVRALQSLATPETEQQWLEFALENSTEAVARKVSMSPTHWKRHRALEASLRKESVVSREAVKEVLQEEPRSGRLLEVRSSAEESQSVQPQAKLEEAFGEGPEEGGSRLPTAPQKIRVVVELTPGQFALYEAAEARVRAQAGKRLARADGITRMAEIVLDQGTARARARHQVLIHTCENCQNAWYETGEGVVPASPEVLEEALVKSTPLRVESLGTEAIPSEPQDRESTPLGRERPNPPGELPGETTSASPRHHATSSTGRSHIPNSTLRALFARAGNSCERCGARGVPLDVHHIKPVCEGGGNTLQELRLYCRACHTLHHRKDLEEKPSWGRAREAAMNSPRAERFPEPGGSPGDGGIRGLTSRLDTS